MSNGNHREASLFVQRGLEQYNATMTERDALRAIRDQLEHELMLARHDNEALTHRLAKAEAEADHYKVCFIEAEQALTNSSAVLSEALNRARNAPYQRKPPIVENLAKLAGAIDPQHEEPPPSIPGFLTDREDKQP